MIRSLVNREELLTETELNERVKLPDVTASAQILRRGIFIVFLTVSTLFAGCDLADGPGSDPFYELVRQKSRFEKVASTDYKFEFLELCFCAYRGPLEITVSDNEVVSIIDIETGNPPDFPMDSWNDRYVTIQGLFDKLIGLYLDNPASFDIEYHPDFAYPTHAFVDRSLQIADEEWGFNITNFTPVGSDD